MPCEIDSIVIQCDLQVSQAAATCQSVTPIGRLKSNKSIEDLPSRVNRFVKFWSTSRHSRFSRPPKQLHRVSEKREHFLFLLEVFLELRQISTNFDKFW